MGRIRGRSGNAQAQTVRRVKQSYGTTRALTNSPTADKGIHELVHHEDDSDPREPACDVRGGTEGPVAA